MSNNTPNPPQPEATPHQRAFDHMKGAHDRLGLALTALPSSSAEVQDIVVLRRKIHQMMERVSEVIHFEHHRERFSKEPTT